MTKSKDIKCSIKKHGPTTKKQPRKPHSCLSSKTSAYLEPKRNLQMYTPCLRTKSSVTGMQCYENKYYKA